MSLKDISEHHYTQACWLTASKTFKIPVCGAFPKCLQKLLDFHLFAFKETAFLSSQNELLIQSLNWTVCVCQTEEQAQRALLIQGTESLNNATQSIARSQRIAVESEQIGTDVIEELGQQREQLDRTRGRVRRTAWHPGTDTGSMIELYKQY